MDKRVEIIVENYKLIFDLKVDIYIDNFKNVSNFVIA